MGGEIKCKQAATPFFNDPFISPPLRLLLELIGMAKKNFSGVGGGEFTSVFIYCDFLRAARQGRPPLATGQVGAAATQIQHSAARYISTRRK